MSLPLLCSSKPTLHYWLLVGWLLCCPVVQATTLNIGIFQRFGENPDQAIVRSIDRKPLQIVIDGRQPLMATQISVQTQKIPLTTPMSWSRVVVSSQRSFEDAQAVAQQLKILNISSEIARPKRWQVWVKRLAALRTAEQQALVTQLLKAGFSTAHIEEGQITQNLLLALTINGQTLSGQQVTIQSAQNQVQFGQRTYGGSLWLQPNAYGTYTIINQVELETYLRGVVPYEIAPTAPYEAIKAQAIVARTFALRNRHRFQIDSYDLCATPNCQVYRGLGGTTPLTERAVRATRHQVLTYGGRLVDALYTSANGGQTARYSDLFSGEDRPYLVSRLDRPENLPLGDLSDEVMVRRLLGYQEGFNESGAPTFHWSRTYSSERLAASLNLNLPTIGLFPPAIKAITGIQVAQRSPSGRVLRLRVQTDQGEIALTKDAILSAIDGLPSTLFYLDASPSGEFLLKGGGWGHGLGLSQYGSYGLARRGYDYAAILRFYFPQTKLDTIAKSE